MVGLVIVSHSRALAEALLVLVRQMAGAEAPIAIAAGVGDDRKEIGTDAVEILEAIQSVFSKAGVLVMMDLGSAILSAEMALELLPPEIAGLSNPRALIRLCPGPVVEGSLAAAVQVALGSDLNSVYREAREALRPKIEQLGEAAPKAVPSAQPSGVPEEAQSTALQLDLTLHNEHGLHARPAARFVKLANSFKANIQVTNLTTGKGPVAANSMNAVATLGALNNHQIRLLARGEEAAQALDALRQLVEDNFGEQAILERPALPAAEIAAPSESLAEASGASAAGIPISEGIALAPLFHYRPPLPSIPKNKVDDPQKEWQRFENALQQTRQAIEQRRRQLTSTLGEAHTAIFEAHLMILEDPNLLQQVRRQIEQEHDNAALAWKKSVDAVAASFRELEDTYLQQRAVDVEDIGSQLLFSLAGKSTTGVIKLEEPVILFAQEITPTETSLLDMSKVLGLLTVGGGPTSHSAILARQMGIPAISGVSLALEEVKDGSLVAMDGATGLIWLDPASELRESLEARRQAWVEEHRRLLAASQALATTRDGRRIEVAANVGSATDAEASVQNGAEGVGLLRTEFLFLSRQTPPSEEEQVAALRQIGEIMGERPVIVRTLDVGGDKEVPYIQLPDEANPFLGVRALRMSLNYPDLFLTQLRAILRAGHGLHFRIMFPMVANVDEVRQARGWLEKAHQILSDEKQAHVWPIETGIMVEIPSAALLSPLLAHEVDFFSIGTNDLTQYTLAAERGNPLLAGLADGLHPAVLRLIADVARASHAAGKWTGICGELGGDPLAVPILVGLGVDELSLNPAGIPRIKAILRALDSTEAKSLAARALEAESAVAVRKLAEVFFREKLDRS